MPKKQQQKNTVKQKAAVTVKPNLPPKTASFADKAIFFLSNKRNQLFLITIVTLVFYGNTIYNDYAMDDSVFIYQNKFVQQGFSGIYDLFTKESMYGLLGKASPFSGGRWRPLSLITFAIEKQFLGQSPHFSHFINLLLLAVTGLVMLLFLRKYIFKSSPLAAFMTVLFFIILPVHTEAVANIKSRDELMSFLFLVLTLYCSLNYLSKRDYRQLIYSLVFYFIALLSKEGGVSFFAILPLTFYFFTNEKLKTILITTIPFVVVLGIYFAMRFTFVPLKIGNNANEVMNAPYLYATPIQHFATVLMMLGKYILLLFWANPLSADYSYNQVPYVTFTDWRVWLSIIIQAALVIYALMRIKDKNIIAYGILFYFCSIFIYSNLFIDIGTFIGERFVYQASFGFCLVIVATVMQLLPKIKFKDVSAKFSALAVLVSIIVLLSGFQTIRRNAQWKNDTTIWSADVKTVPNSARAQMGSAMADINTDTQNDTVLKRQLLKEAVMHSKLAVKIQPTYIVPWLSMGVAYFLLNNVDSAEFCWNQIHKLNPNDALNDVIRTTYYPQLCIHYMNAGLSSGRKKDYTMAKSNFYRALQYDKDSPEAWYNLGGFYYTTANYDSARIAWQQCLKLNPGYTNAQQGLKALPPDKNQTTN